MNVTGFTKAQTNRSRSLLLVIRHVTGIVVLLLIAIAGYLLSLRPQNSGTVRLEELTAPVLVVRDALGIPCIAAVDEQSAFFSLGYVHAQDRLWQMEVFRRAAWGELTPLFGKGCLALDVWHRRIGFYRQAMEIRSSLTEREHRVLTAYVKGITSYLRAHPARLQPEFLLSRLRPAMWKIEDILAIGAMCNWLAVPCSLRVPEELALGEFSLNNIVVSMDQVPEGLSPFLSRLLIEAAPRGPGMECRLSLGKSLPSPWHESVIRIGDREPRRGWVIPGWPVPHVICSHRFCRAMVTDEYAGDPWIRGIADIQKESLLEFLDSSPLDGHCDTVRIADGLSYMSGLSARTDHLATRGSPGWNAEVISEAIGLWTADEDADSTLFTDSPFTVMAFGEGTQMVSTHAAIEERTHRLVTLKPLIKFEVLDFFFPAERTVTVAMLSVPCAAYSQEVDGAPAAVRVAWEPHRLQAVLAGGESGVAGSRYRMNQMRMWERGELSERILSFPVTSRGVMLIPLDG